MGYSREAYEYALTQVARRQEAARREAEARQIKLENEMPEWKTLEERLSQVGLAAVKAATSLADTDRLTVLRAEYEDLSQKRKALLAAKGIKEEDLLPRYTCPVCHDGGYHEGKLCDCARKLARQYEFERMSKQMPLAASTFDKFDLSYYDGKDKDAMAQTLDYCKQYAADFSLDAPSLLMHGKTGLGKTHLSLAIVNEALNKGYGAVYAPAQTLLDKIERERFRRGEEESDTLGLLTECDLLVIDDLGAEFRTAFTEAAIGNLLNNRVLAGKPTIISTNLTAAELNDAYGERVMSRILGYYQRLAFVGADVRQQKRMRGIRP